MDLSVQLAPKNRRGLLLANPVMTASGTFGYGTEYGPLFDIQNLGAIIHKRQQNYAKGAFQLRMLKKLIQDNL